MEQNKAQKVSQTQCILLFVLVSIMHTMPAFAQPYLIENASWQSNITPSNLGAVVLGDIDNDGDLDLIQQGYGWNPYIAKVYTNNGTSFVENATWGQNLTPVRIGSLVLGDIDNDGDLDLIITGCNNGGDYVDPCNVGGFVAKVYTNNGTSFVENVTWGQNIIKTVKGSLVLGDIDNDGDLDLIITGESDSGFVAKVYTNNGTSFVENVTWGQNFTSVRQSGSVLGDIDNDGDLDLIIAGRNSDFNRIVKVYTNNGTSFVENVTWGQNINQMDDSSLVLGDIDNDGDLDLSITGCCDKHRIYRNDDLTFNEIQKDVLAGGNLNGIFAGSQSFGDYNNDGYLDLITTGREGYTTVYRFNGSLGNFSGALQDTESQIIDLIYSSVVWGDLNNDRRLDVMIIGYQLGVFDVKARVFLNNFASQNAVPSTPTLFNSSYATGRLSLSWGSGADTETPDVGLYYNLRIGACSGCNNIISGAYGGGGDNGYFGNMMQRRSIKLNIPNQTYYWSVQTIDTGLAKSSWSTEQVYILPSATTTTTTTTASTTTTAATGSPAGGGGGGGPVTTQKTTTTIGVATTTTASLPSSTTQFHGLQTHAQAAIERALGEIDKAPSGVVSDNAKEALGAAREEFSKGNYLLAKGLAEQAINALSAEQSIKQENGAGKTTMVVPVAVVFVAIAVLYIWKRKNR